MANTVTQIPSAPIWPGTNYQVSANALRVILTAQQATLTAGDYLLLYQTVEGSALRELINDVHSLSLLVYCAQPLSFALSLRPTSGTTYSLCKLCTISTANVWTLIPLPNLPVWSPSATWPITPGTGGYLLGICLAAGSTWMPPANDSWQAGNFIGAVGMTNFASLPVNTAFWIGLVQHEPGSLCTGPIDLPFSQNHHECLRFFDKSYNYAIQPGSASGLGALIQNSAPSNPAYGPYRFKRDMAKIPNVTLYGATNGQINTVYNNSTAANVGVTGVLAIGTGGYYGWTLASYPAAVQIYSWQHTADTGW
jgi:hypothetical protein